MPPAPCCFKAFLHKLQMKGRYILPRPAPPLPAPPRFPRAAPSSPATNQDRANPHPHASKLPPTPPPTPPLSRRSKRRGGKKTGRRRGGGRAPAVTKLKTKGRKRRVVESDGESDAGPGTATAERLADAAKGTASPRRPNRESKTAAASPSADNDVTTAQAASSTYAAIFLSSSSSPSSSSAASSNDGEGAATIAVGAGRRSRGSSSSSSSSSASKRARGADDASSVTTNNSRFGGLSSSSDATPSSTTPHSGSAAHASSHRDRRRGLAGSGRDSIGSGLLIFGGGDANLHRRSTNTPRRAAAKTLDVKRTASPDSAMRRNKRSATNLPTLAAAAADWFSSAATGPGGGSVRSGGRGATAEQPSSFARRRAAHKPELLLRRNSSSSSGSSSQPSAAAKAANFFLQRRSKKIVRDNYVSYASDNTDDNDDDSDINDDDDDFEGTFISRQQQQQQKPKPKSKQPQQRRRRLHGGVSAGSLPVPKTKGFLSVHDTGSSSLSSHSTAASSPAVTNYALFSKIASSKKTPWENKSLSRKVSIDERVGSDDYDDSDMDGWLVRDDKEADSSAGSGTAYFRGLDYASASASASAAPWSSRKNTGKGKRRGNGPRRGGHETLGGPPAAASARKHSYGAAASAGAADDSSDTSELDSDAAAAPEMKTLEDFLGQTDLMKPQQVINTMAALGVCSLADLAILDQGETDELIAAIKNKEYGVLLGDRSKVRVLIESGVPGSAHRRRSSPGSCSSARSRRLNVRRGSQGSSSAARFSATRRVVKLSESESESESENDATGAGRAGAASFKSAPASVSVPTKLNRTTKASRRRSTTAILSESSNDDSDAGDDVGGKKSLGDAKPSHPSNTADTAAAAATDADSVADADAAGSDNGARDLRLASASGASGTSSAPSSSPSTSDSDDEYVPRAAVEQKKRDGKRPAATAAKKRNTYGNKPNNQRRRSATAASASASFDTAESFGSAFAARGAFPEDFDGEPFALGNLKYQTRGLEACFNSFMQLLVSGAIDPECFEAFQEEEDGQYREARTTVRNALNDRQEYCVASAVWTKQFKEKLQHYPSITVEVAKSTRVGECEACRRKNHAASRIVVLEGTPYNSDDFSVVDAAGGGGGGAHDPRFGKRMEIRVGPTCAERIKIFHTLEHFQHGMYRKCLRKTKHLLEIQGMEPPEVVHALMQNSQWCHQKFRDLEQVLEDADKYRDGK